MHRVRPHLLGNNLRRALPRQVNHLLALVREHPFRSKEHAFRKGHVRNNLAHKQALVPQPRDSHCVRVNLLHPCVLPCQRAWAIAGPFRVPLREVSNDRVDRDPANRCDRKVPAVKVAIVRTLRVRAGLVVRVDKADLVVRGKELLGKGLVRRRWARGLVRARLDGRQCCRRFQTRCRRRQSRASRSTRASQRNGNGPPRTNAKLKANASFIQPGNVRALVDVVWLFRLHRQNHGRHAILR